MKGNTIMKAMVLPKFGNYNLFELRHLDLPEPGPGEVLVKVIASGTNPVDAKLRANGAWANLSPPVIIGYDVAGIVEAVGAGVNDFVPGNEVYYTPHIMGNTYGSYAEYNIVPVSIIATKPKNISFSEAAVIPLAGGTAWEAVIRRLKVKAGQNVLIHGGAGGVGSFAVQFAKTSGAKVIATASAKNLETLEKLGADTALDYREENLNDKIMKQTDNQGVDAAFDIEGENRVARCLPVVKPYGKIACIIPPQGDLTLLYQKNISLYGVFLTRERKRLEEMRPLFERGQVSPLIEQELPLEEVAKAHQRLDSGHGRGKVVLKIHEN